MENIKVLKLNERTPRLIEQICSVWEKSVRATHKFLSCGEIDEISKYVPEAVKNVPSLIVAEKDGIITAFMGIDKNKLEMLFISPCEIGKGLGKKLLLYGINNYSVNELCVNEQNPNAIAFYNKMGFSVYKRSGTDEQGMPYPILYMRLKQHHI